MKCSLDGALIHGSIATGIAKTANVQLFGREEVVRV